jgi:hypothetical protein
VESEGGEDEEVLNYVHKDKNSKFSFLNVKRNSPAGIRGTQSQDALKEC